MGTIEELAAKIEAGGVITQEEVEQIESAVMAGEKLTSGEKRLLLGIIRKLRGTEQKAVEPIEQLVQQIEADGIVTKEELDQLHSAIMADGKVSSDERMILQSIVDKIRTGKLKEG